MKKTLIILFIMFLLCGTLLYAADMVKVRQEVQIDDRDPNPNNHYVPSTPVTDDLFDFQFEWPVGVGGGEAGIETDGTYMYTTKWNGGTFFRYAMDGTYIEEFTVTGCPGNIRDLAYDGTYFYGASATNTVYEMDFDTQTVISTISAPIAVRAIAYDGASDGFWANNWSDTITLFDRSGATLNSFPCGVYQSYYGFAWEDALPGGPYLWGYCQDGASTNQLVQFDIATGLETGVNFDIGSIFTVGTGIAGGLCISDAFVLGKWTICGTSQNTIIWGVELTDSADPLAPAAPTDVFVVPDAGGALEVDIDWVCPTLQVNGEPLTDLDEMRVYRGEDLIYTDSAPVIGGPGNYTDVAAPLPGQYTYKVVGFNDFGEGIPVSETVWVGEDVPNVVENLLLEQSAPGVLSGTLTWDNPTTGLNGGAFNEPILGYHIVRYPDVVPFEPTGIATSYVDDTIPVVGVYWYTVQAYNSTGDGGTETSNAVLIADPGLLIMEDFTAGVPPAGWYVDGLGQTNWSSSASTNAGGSSPELRFSWSPSFVGISRMCTMPVNTEGFVELSLEFKHYVNDYAGSGYSLGVATTSDGATWNTAWQISPTTSIPATTETIVINTPDVGSPTFQMAFFLDGDSFQINYWYIDDVLLVTLEHGDVEGVVTDAVTTNPIEGAEVWIDGYPSTITNANGEYLLESITTGMRDIFAVKDGYYNYEGVVEVLPDVAVTYDIAMDPALLGALDGEVTDADTGDPLVGAQINAISDGGYAYDTVTNDVGYYSIVDVVAETYDVFCSFPNYPTEVVEDVLVESGLTTTVNFVMEGYTYWCDFENSDGGLISDNPSGWQWGTPTNGPASAYSGVKLWGTVLNANYPANANFTLDTPVPFFIVEPNAGMEFMHWYDIETSWDGGNVKVSADGGTSWSVITPLAGYTGTANSANPLYPEPIFCGTSPGWELVEFDLSGFVGQSIIVRWHFGADSSVQYPGWFIDDVSVWGGEIPDQGSLEGIVTEFGTGTPIEGAVVSIVGSGLNDTTLADGTYDIQGIWPGDYDITCESPLYLPAEELGFTIGEGVNTLDFSMLWSEIAVDVTELTSFLAPDETEVQTFVITNDGPGELQYNISFDFPVDVRVRNGSRNHPVPNSRESTKISKNMSNVRNDSSINDRDPRASNHSHGVPATDDLFDLQFDWPVGVGGGEAGIETDGTYMYTTKWNGGTFYRYAMDGTYIEEFSVTGCPGNIRDLAYDGTYFYGASATNTVYEMDFDTQTVISTISAPIAVRAIAYDGASDGFWANNWSDTITLFDRSGATLNSFPCGVYQSYYGFAWEDALPGGPFLWGYCQDGPTLNQLVQFDIATGLETGVNFDIGSICAVGTGIAGGMCISDAFVPGKWTICGTSQNVNIWGVELGDAVSWVMATNNASGIVSGNGGTIVVDITFDATELLIGDVLTADMLIHNNSNYVATRGDDYVIPVTLTVTGFIPPSNLYVNEATGLFIWDAPPGPNLLGYNVFLDGTLEGTTTATEWQYEDLNVGQAYIAGVSAVYDDGESIVMEYEFIYQPDDAGDIIPLITELRGNFPNPFNPDTQIAFSLNKQSHVQITIYNIRGQLVRTLVDEQRDANNYTATWDGTDDGRKQVSSGIYFYKMKAEKYTATKKMILMK